MITPFGSGVLFGKQTSLSGVSTANATPRRFGLLQDAQVDLKGESKKMYGQFQVALAHARGKLDISVKAKLASPDPLMLNDLYLGCPTSTGIVQIADLEPVVAAAGGNVTARANNTIYAVGALYSSGGYVYKCVTAGESAAAVPGLETILGSENADGTAVFQCIAAAANSVAVANAANFLEDWGLWYTSGTGQELQNSGSVAPLQGQYQCNGGLYTLNAADMGVALAASYSWANSARGVTVNLTNQLQGAAPEFESFLYDTDENGKFFGLKLFRCRGTDVSLPTKQGEFWTCSFDFDALATFTGSWGALYADTY